MNAFSLLRFALIFFLPSVFGQDIRPNIIFIMADDFGYYDIGYHGRQIKTPNLKKLSAKGVKLESYYVQPVCAPTRSAFMSGRYPIHNGLWHGNIDALPLDSLTMADQLKKAGYQTHMAGKWHLGFETEAHMPTSRGFDTFYGFLQGHNTYYSHKHGYKGKLYLDWRDEKGPIFDESHLYSTNLLTNRTIEKIKEHESSKGPMFFYLAYQSVHGPLKVPSEYSDRYNTTIESEDRRTYAGMVAAMDDGVGKITEALRDTGMWDNTILVFSTDNGGYNNKGGWNWPLRGEKDSLFEGGIRGNCFVAGGAVGPSGVVNHELFHVSDWFPTFVNLANGSYEGTKTLDGVDQWKTINETAKSPRNVILHQIDTLTRPRGKAVRKYKKIWDTRIMAAIRIGDLKLMTGNPGPAFWRPVPGVKHKERPVVEELGNKNLWLFNVTSDPEERNDLSPLSERQEDVKRLLTALAEFNKEIVPLVDHSEPELDLSQNGEIFFGPWKKEISLS